ncbi:MAG TPA: hypothetical protein VEA40_23070 [Ramlibacter sp.]|nr:hypothetical protein [Ramlibacter sp.]
MKRLAGWMLALATGSALPGPATTVRLPARVDVQPGPVVLGDVALISSTDLDLLRRLLAVPVGVAPAAGQPRELRGERLQQWIARRVGPEAVGLAWEGAPETLVSVRSRTVRGAEITGAALQGLSAWLVQHQPGARAELAEAPPRDLQVPDGDLLLASRPPSTAARDRMVVWVEVRQADQVVRAVPVRLAVTLPSAPAPARPAERTAPAVQRGDWSWLHSRSGAVATQVRVEVLQDGRTGDRIRVRAAGAQESLLASVIGPDRLEVAR